MASEPLAFSQKLHLVLSVLVVALVIVLFFQNRETVTTHVLFWSPETPRFVLLGMVFVIGTFAGDTAGRGGRRR